MRVHVCVRHLSTDCDRINRYLSSRITLHVFPPKTQPPPHPPPFLSTGSIRHLVFSTSLTTRENERIIGQGTRVRSHMAPRFFQTFHPIPPPPPLYSWKRKLPENCRSKSDRGPGKTFLFFFFFFFFSPFSILSINDIRKKKKKMRNRRAKFSQFFRSKNRTKENSKKRERRM